MLQEQHNAIIRNHNGSLTNTKIPTPIISDDELLVKITAAGICGTDLEIISGTRNDTAKIIGHEGVGRIIRVGKNIQHAYKIDDIVTFLPHSHYDPDSIIGHNKDGLFQQKRVITKQEIEQGIVVKVTQKIPYELIPLCEPLSTLIYSQQLMQQANKKPKSIAIFGAGQTGLIYAIYCRTIHPKAKIMLLHRSQKRLDWAISNKIVSAENAIVLDSDAPSTVLRITQQEGVDHALLCTSSSGNIDALSQAMTIIKPNGCIDLYSGFNKDYVVPNTSLCIPYEIRRKNVCGLPSPGYIEKHTINNKTINFTGHRGLGQAQAIQALDILMQHEAEFRRIITHTISMDGATSLLNQYMMDKNRVFNGKEFLKVMVLF